MSAGPLSHAIDERRATGERGFSIEEPAQVVGQRLRRHVSFVPRPCHRAEHDRLQIDRHRGIDLARRGRLFVDDLSY
jgi:hypothetical protein